MGEGLALGPLGQIALPVEDPERATAFYRDTLGLPHLFSAGPLAFFDCGGVRLMLSPPEGDGPRAGSTLYFKVGDIAAAHAALQARGVAFVDEPHVIAEMADHTLWMVFFRDSEGNLLGLMSEAPR
ncbi:MAG TPA: VOC family protein [Herpetosiphonaceae bacterium]